MRHRPVAALLGVVLLAASLGVVGSGASAAPPLRVLIVGDSVTQGSSGDWTWRYRLWQHLHDAGVDVDFVGPRDDLWDNLEGHAGDHSYVDPDFDQDHAARWGMSLAFQDQPIAQLVTAYHPDVVLELLGVNDLTFLQETPSQVAGLTEDFIDDARGADPAVDVVLGRVPQPAVPAVATFNGLLDDLAARLDDPGAGARVVTADSDAGYDLAEDTFDNGHPNSHGELKIAAGFEDALAGLGIGRPAQRPLADLPRGPRIAPVLSATASVGAVSLSWVRSPGSQKSEVWLRDVTGGDGWVQVDPGVTGTASEIDGLPQWHRVEVQTRPYKGFWQAAADAWSNVVTVEVVGDHLDRPAVSATAAGDGTAALAWTAVPGATSYAVQLAPVDRPDAWADAATVAGTSATVRGLANRAGYLFRVRGLRDSLAGAWSDPTPVAVPALGPVLRVKAIRTGHGVRTSGKPVAAATSYTLRVATADRCRTAPAAGRFRVSAKGLASPTRKLRIDARAVWVRWVAVRAGVEGDLAPGSTACVLLPR